MIIQSVVVVTKEERTFFHDCPWYSITIDGSGCYPSLDYFGYSDEEAEKALDTDLQRYRDLGYLVTFAQPFYLPVRLVKQLYTDLNKGQDGTKIAIVKKDDRPGLPSYVVHMSGRPSGRQAFGHTYDEALDKLHRKHLSVLAGWGYTILFD